MKLAGYALLVLAGALLAYVILPNDPIVYSEVIVPTRAIEVREPPARAPTVVERIRYVSIPPRQVATAPGGAQGDVVTFCAPTVAQVAGDTITHAPALLIRSGTHTPGWFWGKDKLLLTGPTSTGDLRALDYSVRPGFDFRASGDSVLVRYPRTGLLRQVVEIGVPLAIGYGIARIAP
jgi:hypothetical protein